MKHSDFELDTYLFFEGTAAYSYRLFGCHTVALANGKTAKRFTVYAPHATEVSVVGSFNGWDISKNNMEKLNDCGIWQAIIENASNNDLYKYAIRTKSGQILYKADPYAFRSQHRPETASVVWEIEHYDWTDQAYMEQCKRKDPYHSPMSIYEVHLGSWKLGKGLYELSTELVQYVKDMGYTHIELLPVSEFPLDDSWGYQVTGYYSITTRYGTPYDLKHFVNECHKHNIGVIADWVPAHFAKDEHGLRCFDGEPLYEHSDPRRSEQPQWGTTLFDFSKPAVRSFLLSNAIFLLKEFHIDGLRVDACSCMLYLDYGKKEGEYLPNQYGGRENLDAIDFLRTLAKTVGRECPSALLIAEESTAFPLVTMPPEHGGLGFNFKWNMGYMNDTLYYISMDSYFRKHHHDKLTFSMMYAFSENFILPFSHDEVVHGKRSLIEKMPGSYDEKFAQLRLLYMYQFAHPGKKLMFMGCEFGQFIEWDFRRSLDFFLLDYPRHREMKDFVRELNFVYRENTPFYAYDTSWEGFSWLIVGDKDRSLIAFMRHDKRKKIICVLNFTPVKYEKYKIEVPESLEAEVILHSNDVRFGGNLESTKYTVKSYEENDKHYIDLDIEGYSGIYLRVKQNRSAYD